MNKRKNFKVKLLLSIEGTKDKLGFFIRVFSLSLEFIKKVGFLFEVIQFCTY
jgi:hypothetical protein